MFSLEIILIICILCIFKIILFIIVASLGILSVGTCLGYSSPAGFQLREDESTTNSSSVRASPLGINLLHFPLQTSDHSEAGLIQTNIYNYRTLNDSESGDNIVFNDDLTLTTSQLSWFSSSFNLGALVGGLISSPMMNFIGRRGSMIVSLIPSTAGWLLLGKCMNVTFLWFRRSYHKYRWQMNNYEDLDSLTFDIIFIFFYIYIE